MILMAEKSWNCFIELYYENRELTKDSLPYRRMVHEFGIPFMAKLLDTALNGSSITARKHAATLLIDLCEEEESSDLLKKAYLNLPLATLDFFRRSAILLMVSSDKWSQLSDCGMLLTANLVRLSLVHNHIDGWSELLELAEKGFSTQPEILDLILDVFCELLPLRRHIDKFVSFLEPCVARNAEKFIARLVDLLEQGDDYRAFMVLPYVHRLFSQRRWKILMRGAIMSPFFQTITLPSMRICAADYLIKSIEITEFNFSSDLIPYMRDIILVLFESMDATETSKAYGLCAALLNSGIKTCINEVQWIERLLRNCR